MFYWALFVLFDQSWMKNNAPYSYFVVHCRFGLLYANHSAMKFLDLNRKLIWSF